MRALIAFQESRHLTGDRIDPEQERVPALARRLERERKARREAESIAERATSDLYLTVQELKSLNKALREFVAIASHDLRSPLTTILGFTSLLIRSWESLPENERLDFIRTVDRAAHQIERLVSDLLTISKIEAGVIETHLEAVCLSEATREAIAVFSESAAEIQLSIPADLTVLVDPDHLQRILTNYIANAVTYGNPPIRLEALGEEGWVAIRVVDQGSGVPEEFVPSLFGKFVRADTPKARLEKGTGLGLSIVRGLAQANGGDAWYEPNRPSGSCFVVRLPRAS